MSGDVQAPGASTPMPPEAARMFRLLRSMYARVDVGNIRAAARLEFDGIPRDERIAALFHVYKWPETPQDFRGVVVSHLFGDIKSYSAHFLLSWSPIEIHRFVDDMITAATLEQDVEQRSLLARAIVATVRRTDGRVRDNRFDTIFPDLTKLMKDDYHTQSDVTQWILHLAETAPSLLGQSPHLGTILRICIESCDSLAEHCEEEAEVLARVCLVAPSSITLEMVPKIVNIVLVMAANAFEWRQEWLNSKAARVADDLLSSLGPTRTLPILLEKYEETKSADDSELFMGLIALMEAGERSRGREEEERIVHKIIDCLDDTVDSVRSVASATLIRIMPRWSPDLHDKVMATISSMIDGLLNNQSTASIIDLSPFLPTLMPSILKAARDGDEGAWQKSVPSQKDVAQRKLLCLARVVDDAFVPYIDQTATLIIISLSKTEEDSRWALEMAPLLLKIVKSQGATEATMLWLKLWPALKGRGGMKKEQRGILYETVRACAKLLGPELIGHVERAEILQLLKEE